MKVSEAAVKLNCSTAVVRDGIQQGKLPGVAIPSGEKCKYIIPDGGLNLFLATGIPTHLLAEKIMSADCPEQAIAMIRKALQPEEERRNQ